MNKPITLCDRCDICTDCLLNYDGIPCRRNRTVEPTNADRIRAMTDEELANLINRIEPKFCHDGWDYMIGCDEDKDCVMCWLDWLKQEAYSEK